MLYLRILKTKRGLCTINAFDGYAEISCTYTDKKARALVYDVQNRVIVYNCAALEASC